jgi:NAD(P)-dependent dehydrogenase (short-subunit alcohol dehydrogenase family)
VDGLYVILKKECIIIDILVNNTGIISPFVKIIDSDPLKWWQEISIHINIIYLMSRDFLKQLASSDTRPTIINTSSMDDIEPSLIKSGSSVYYMRKITIIKFTEFLNVENPNIWYLVYHPGGIETDLVKEAFPKEVLISGFWIDTPELAGGYYLWMTTDRADFMINRWGRFHPYRVLLI